MSIIERYPVIFWDFDGVIKESVDVKTQAYITLFEHFGVELAERVREHHESQGGLSRFEKLPLYLQWAGEVSSPLLVQQYCDQFARLVVDKVINSPWVSGVEEYIRGNIHQQVFVLVSATPQQELDQILTVLNLKACFVGVFGAPVNKKDAINHFLNVAAFEPTDCLMIGDAREDQQAAHANGVSFLLRRHASNALLFTDYTGTSLKDFTVI
ncbi:MAG: HAD hydrolase-like protein [Chlorobium sp.]|nr:MAG: HAD family hydrolase [Chlorobium sp.]